jgi:endonuclease III
MAPRKTKALLRRVAFIQGELDRLFPDPPIPLYHINPYTLCIAVLMSAHTTDKAVNQVTPELFRRASDPKAMVQLGVEGIYNIIKSVGLAPTKSRHIHGLSVLLLEKHGGILPESWEALEALPGVGHKTASVVMSQAFGHAAFAVDTHIHRLAERWGLSDGKSVEKTESDLKSLFSEKAWTKLHLQMIYFGREYCPARHHQASLCPICGPLQKGV